MKKFLVFLLSLFSLTIVSGPVSAASTDQSAPAGISSGGDDQTGIEITIYNVNLGLVKDSRQVKMPTGTAELRFMDVASQIIPSSVHIKSLSDSGSLAVLEQNYEYDLLNPQKLLDKYIGKEVKLYQKNPYTEREEIIPATLLSNNNGPIFKINGEITFGHPGRIVFPGVPENLISKPTLVWLLENRRSSLQKIEASYLTNGINWRADYVLAISQNDDKADLSGWVTIENKSGATYRDARLKLVAGDVNRVREERDYKYRTMKIAEAAAAPGKQFAEESFFEYHIYTLQRTSTVKDNQSKQISLVSADSIPVRKLLEFRGADYYYTARFSDPMNKQKVNVFMELQNKADHNLGMPLPKGIVRVYKNDKDGSLQFIGEDSIDHTPKDEKIRIKLGDAFDVVGSRKQTDWKKVASDTYEAAFEISLRNHKKEDISVKVIEPVHGDWTMLNSSHEYKKSEAFAAEFNIQVPKDKTVTLSYRVRMRY